LLKELLLEAFDLWAKDWEDNRLPSLVADAEDKVPGLGAVLIEVWEDLRDTVRAYLLGKL
jgi:hypothetical protein